MPQPLAVVTRSLQLTSMSIKNVIVFDWSVTPSFCDLGIDSHSNDITIPGKFFKTKSSDASNRDRLIVHGSKCFLSSAKRFSENFHFASEHVITFRNR